MPTLYMKVAYLCWAAIGIVWFIGNFGNKKTVERPHMAWQIRVSLLMLVGFLLLAGLRVPYGLGARLTPQSDMFGALGDALCIVSALFAIWARRTLGKNWSGAIPTLKENHELVQTGPYQYVRHPIYTGFLFAALGTALTIGLAASYLGVACIAAAFLLRIREEEALMTRQFPQAYPVYKARSKTLIPFVW